MQINTAEDLENKIARARVVYPALWCRFIREWREAGSGNSEWLMYAASYLFATSGVHWAMDPLWLSTRINVVPQPDYEQT